MPSVAPYESPYSSPGSILWVIFVLLLVFVGAYFVTKFVGGRMRGFSRTRYMRTIESLPVGRDRAVVLVEASGHYYLLGVTGHNIQLITVIPDDELEGVEQPESVFTKAPAEGEPGTPMQRAAAWVSNFVHAPKDLQRKRAQGGSGRRTAQERPSFEAFQAQAAQAEQQAPAELPTAQEVEADDLDEMMRSIAQRRSRMRRDGGKGDGK